MLVISNSCRYFQYIFNDKTTLKKVRLSKKLKFSNFRLKSLRQSKHHLQVLLVQTVDKSQNVFQLLQLNIALNVKIGLLLLRLQCNGCFLMMRLNVLDDRHNVISHSGRISPLRMPLTPERWANYG